MPIKKIFIFLIIFLIGLFFFRSKIDFSKTTSIINNINNIIFNTTYDNPGKTNEIIRVYNQHPFGKELILQEGTRFLLKEEGIVLTAIDEVIIPGMQDGDPGYVDIEVELNSNQKIDNEELITVPGLVGTDYEKTTWAEVVNFEEEIEQENTEEEKQIIEIKGVISGDTIWSDSDSYYIITGNVLIPEGVMLLIEPGIEVFFAGDYYILIEGELRVIGKEKNNIKLYGGKDNKLNFSY